MLSNRITTPRWMHRPASVFLVVLTLLASGCTDSNDPVPPPESLRIEAVSATELQGTVGEAVNPIPTVIVKTPEGEPVSGISVSFTLAGGSEWSGSVSTSTAVSNKQGIATPGNWTLGAKAISQELTATLLVEGPPRSVQFTANATAGAPTQIWARSDTLAGLPEWSVNGPAVIIRDRFGNRSRVGGVLVSFSITAGDGHLEKTEVETDSSGYASAGSWTLGTNPGLNSVTATADGLGEVTFTAQALDVRKLVWYDLDSIEDTDSAYFDHGSIGLSFIDDRYFVAETYYFFGRRSLGGKFTTSLPPAFPLVDPVTSLEFTPTSGDDQLLLDGYLTDTGLVTSWSLGGDNSYYQQRTYTKRIEDETPAASRNRQR